MAPLAAPPLPPLVRTNPACRFELRPRQCPPQPGSERRANQPKAFVNTPSQDLRINPQATEVNTAGCFTSLWGVRREAPGGAKRKVPGLPLVEGTKGR